MSSVWVICPKWWSLSAAQSALSAVIVILALVSTYALNEVTYWHACNRIFNTYRKTPLSVLLPITSLGEAWETVRRRKLKMLRKKNRGRLILSITIAMITMLPTWSSAITNAAVQNRLAVRRENINTSWTTKGDGSTGNLMDAGPLWNDTISSLNQANFPYDQLLEFLPELTEPWVYVSQDGDNTFYYPIDDFAAYRDTFDQRWLAAPEFRIDSDWTFNPTLWSIIGPQTNNETLRVSISALHAQDFGAVNYTDTTEGAARQWRPFGPVGNASYTRVECDITPRLDILNASYIPYPWTNDTFSIALAYRSFWALPLQVNSTKGLAITPPTPKELLRFYQAYMVQVNTMFSPPTRRTVSTKKLRVHIHASLLAMIFGWAGILMIAFGWLHHPSDQEQLIREGFCVPRSKEELGYYLARILLDNEGRESFESSAGSSCDVDRLCRVYFRLSTFSKQQLAAEEGMGFRSTRTLVKTKI
ncbi:hypothetical protein DL95DRAFT_465787 [Leptodontidium sp. 2 PMI_412]|nr:hypothetical protein DL95DRAFT_465787 [Leptodontidium sp. 2 PMI_412]